MSAVKRNNLHVSSRERNPGKLALQALVLLGLLAVTLPFWLPEALGGDLALSFILTGSMRGELGPGSFVVLRRSSSYKLGDIVGYRLYQPDGGYIVLVHRIVDRLPDGVYIFKGDANRSTETVGADLLIGKLVMGIPGLGFVPGAINSSPMIPGMLLLTPFLFRRVGGGRRSARRKSLFLTSLVAVVLAMPFYSVGLAEMFGTVQASALILGFLGGTRLLEVIDPWPEFRVLVDLGYMLIVLLSMLMISVPDVMDSFRLLRAEF